MTDPEERDDDMEQLAAELDALMTSIHEPIMPSAGLLARIQSSVAEPPQRYAPFYHRIAELFDMPEEDVVSELRRLALPDAWRFAGLPGVRNMVVQAGPRNAGAETLFARFAPGTRFPQHRHTGIETVLVLEGEYEDTTGLVHRAGELRTWPAGTNHGFRVSTSGPCVIASVVFGRQFEAAPLRWLARVLGR